jgi:glutathione S-transferase
LSTPSQSSAAPGKTVGSLSSQSVPALAAPSGGAQASVEAGFGYLAHFVTAAPYAAGSQLSLADCTLLPSLLVLRKTAIPAFGLADPTAGSGPLGRWWSTVEADPVTGPFLEEFSTAVDAFLKMLAAK